MAGETERAFAANFRKRTKELRLSRGFTQKEVADFLGITIEAYSKYENRSVLPHYLMLRFCRLIGCELIDLFATPAPTPPPKRGLILRPRKH
jgi:transcriptional regulator with XRE-family HTH domain